MSRAKVNALAIGSTVLRQSGVFKIIDNRRAQLTYVPNDELNTVISSAFRSGFYEPIIRILPTKFKRGDYNLITEYPDGFDEDSCFIQVLPSHRVKFFRHALKGSAGQLIVNPETCALRAPIINVHIYEDETTERFAYLGRL